jgi:hypothetical protein
MNAERRLTNNQYRIEVLENNWNEERFDLKYMSEHRPMPSDVTKTKKLKNLDFWTVFNLIFNLKYSYNYETTTRDMTSNAEQFNKPLKNAVYKTSK